MSEYLKVLAAIKDMHEEYSDKDSFKLSPATVREVF